MSKPVVKTFSKEQPCTKEDIWLAFRSLRGFKIVQVDVAHSIIGKNVPRLMQANGRLLWKELNKEEVYQLTPEGEEWLLEGYRNYLRNHPDRKPFAKFIPREWK